MQNTAPRIVVMPADEGRAFEHFIDIPYIVQGSNPAWVPPLRIQQKDVLDRVHNPFFQHAQMRQFVAYRNGKPVGRIAAIDDAVHNSTHNEQATLWGFFECIDDREVAAALFEAVDGVAASLGHKIIRGPFNPSVNAEIGLQIDAFEQPSYIMIPGNPAYYRGLVEAAGHEKSVDLYCYKVDAEGVSRGLEQRALAAIARNGISYRKLTKATIDADALKIWEIYNKAWEKNWLWVHASKEEFLHLVANLKQIADYDMNFVAENAAGEMVGFSVAVPNINEALIHIRDGRLLPFGWLQLLWHSRPGAIKSLRFLVLGVLEPYRRHGVDVVLNYHQFKEGIRKGYVHAEMSQILETNTAMLRAAESLGGVRYKTHRMYEKRLPSRLAPFTPGNTKRLSSMPST